jgi:pimeloyl-ACP methyl ester carboxylesterase
LAILSVKTIANRCLGRSAPLSIRQDVLGSLGVPQTRSLRQGLELIYTQRCCDITWQPSVLAPVFYGIQDFSLSDGAPVALRVFYPSIEGNVFDAPFLVGCGRYPLVVFLHGNCDEANHYLKWHGLPAQLACSGYVVAVPELQRIASGGRPWEDVDLAEAENVLTWMRSRWEHRLHLMPSPSTGIVGHSYGALLGGRLATRGAVSAYVSLGGVWTEWPSSPPRPLGELKVPSLFAWGQADVFADLGSLWGQVALPKHRLVFALGEHWDYLPANSTTCEDARGPCDLVRYLAADFAATFLSKYMPPQRWPQLRHDIEDNLIPPPHALTEEQQFFAGSHLMGLSLICDNGACSATHRWEVPGPSEGLLTLPQDIC